MIDIKEKYDTEGRKHGFMVLEKGSHNQYCMYIHGEIVGAGVIALSNGIIAAGMSAGRDAVGTWHEYHPDGSVATGEMLEGQYTGTWTIHHIDGSVTTEDRS